MTGGSANRRRRQSEGAHHAGESRRPRKQQMNPAGTIRIRFRKVSAFPDSFLRPHRSPQNEGRTEEIVMILELHRQCISVSAIARWTGLDRKTIRRYIA